MNLSPGAIDYAITHFKYKTPAPIQAQPTNKSLKRLLMELRANASSIETDVGRGDHGYLGLVLDDPDYATIPGTIPFIVVGYPGLLIIPTGTTHVTALQLREDRNKKRIYLKCKNI